MSRKERSFGISASTLKLFAVFSMLVDHTGATVIYTLCSSPAVRADARLYNTLVRLYSMMRAFGRLAFPIYCFFIVEGFLHTRSAAKYAERLFIFALISEIPFDFALKRNWFYPSKQNVYFTLLFGLLAIWGFAACEGTETIQLLVMVAAMQIATLMNTDYGMRGVFLIEILYILRHSKLYQCIGGAAVISWERWAPLSFIPLYFYNGKRGLRLKYFFYAFYPVHLLILGILKRCVKL